MPWKQQSTTPFSRMKCNHHCSVNFWRLGRSRYEWKHMDRWMNARWWGWASSGLPHLEWSSHSLAIIRTNRHFTWHNVTAFVFRRLLKTRRWGARMNVREFSLTIYFDISGGILGNNLWSLYQMSKKNRKKIVWNCGCFG